MEMHLGTILTPNLLGATITSSESRVICIVHRQVYSHV